MRSDSFKHLRFQQGEDKVNEQGNGKNPCDEIGDVHRDFPSKALQIATSPRVSAKNESVRRINMTSDIMPPP
jgi:hypothetical protein